MTHNGKTPAQVVGINVAIGKNKWLDLLKKSVNNKSDSKDMIKPKGLV